MKSKKVFVVIILTASLVTSLTAVRAADEADVKFKITAIDKELGPIHKKAAADPEVKAAQQAVAAAQETLKAAQMKYEAALQATMIKVDPKARELLDQKKQLQQELAASKKPVKAIPPVKAN